jgi:hypothetical protein
MRPVLRLAILSAYVILLLHSSALSAGYLMSASGPELSLSANPTAVVIKVGDTSTINLTVSSEAGSGLVCFSEQGFPSSGFVLTFLPQCATMQQRILTSRLMVEATPAAAPQNFTALILASLGNETASTPLTITVVPAIPAWIPWLGIVLFFLVIGAALFIKPRKSEKRKGKAKMDG